MVDQKPKPRHAPRIVPVTNQRRTRRPQRVLSRFDRARAWLVHAGVGMSLPVLLGLGGAAAGFGYYWIDLADRNTARDLVAYGQWAVVPDPFVHVVYHSGKGGSFFDVDNVRVHLPGVHDTVLLDVVDGPNMDGAIEGWQKPTKNTGYAAPLDVRYRVQEDGALTAMARSDVDYWTISNSDPEVRLALGFGGLALAGLSLAINGIRLTRLERRREQRRELRRTARRAAMGQRKPSDADPD